jgi:fumarate reductase flavoprotein subunit
LTVRDAAEARFEMNIPVVVVGAGAAGLVAALSVAEAGAEVLVVERDALPRGSTALSAGLVPAAGTRWQRAAGIEDSADAFATDIMAKARHDPDPAEVMLLTRTIGPTLEWLHEVHGFAFSVITDFRYPGHSASRMHGLPSRSGEELIDRLRKAVEQAGIVILTSARAHTLFAGPGGAVQGVGFVRPNGSREDVGCRALVLACNGYGGNKALVAQHIPELAHAHYFGHDGNQGDALLWGVALGAATRHLSGHQGHGSVAHPHGMLITWATITEGGVQVNVKGKRFSDESLGYSEQAAVVLAQPEGCVFTVFDERIASIARQFEDFRRAEQMGAVLTADTSGELATRARLPAVALADTLLEVAALKQTGGVDAFGRRFAGVPPLQPPYRAVRVTGALLHTQGGLVIDEEARVLRQDGTVIPNLYAAGGAACGVSGTSAAGYLSGNGLLAAVALGRVAGRSAVSRCLGGDR